MALSDWIKGSLVSGVVIVGITLSVVLWQRHQSEPLIDPRIEKACLSEVKKRAPLGYRSVFTYSYHEESPTLAIASGALEAQLYKGRWSPASWRCRINPSNYEVARIEFEASTSGQRLKAAATAF